MQADKAAEVIPLPTEGVQAVTGTAYSVMRAMWTCLVLFGE